MLAITSVLHRHSDGTLRGGLDPWSDQALRSGTNHPMEDREVLWLTEADQIAQAVGVAARALRNDPDWMAISDDPLVRLEMLYSTFAGSLEGARVAGV